jgi:hypothetical protein
MTFNRKRRRLPALSARARTEPGQNQDLGGRRSWRRRTAPLQKSPATKELAAPRELYASHRICLFMDIPPEAEINRLLVKAGKLRRAAGSTSMSQYRSVMLRVARELEARAAAIAVELERYGTVPEKYFFGTGPGGFPSRSLQK